MLPILFTIGPFNVYTFGIFLSIAFLFSTFLIWREGREELKEEEYIDTFLYTSIVALISARLVYIFFHFSQFGANFLKYIVVRETPGISLVGGLVGGFIFLYWYARKKKYDFYHLADLFALSGSLALGLAKIGEQLGGASFGKETNFIIGVKIIGQTGRHHPVELYEAILIFLLFCFLQWVWGKVKRKRWHQGIVCLFFAAILAIIIFLLEFLKVYPVYLYIFSFRQLGALIILISAAVPLWRRIKIIRQAKL